MESKKAREFAAIRELSPGDIILPTNVHLFNEYFDVLIGTPTNKYNGNTLSRLCFTWEPGSRLNDDPVHNIIHYNTLHFIANPKEAHRYIPMAEVPDLSMAMLMYSRRRLLLGMDKENLAYLGVSPEQVLEDIDKILKTPFDDSVYSSLDKML